MYGNFTIRCLPTVFPPIPAMVVKIITIEPSIPLPILNALKINCANMPIG